ncbi:uncharacterized protein LAESUDRAFT_368461 [Laetiporus sulphureus 93-53]|uniref:AN1-type domain-containing protein n=1 Tax=Laetiporus sulphureus 93-53 TaxID=1314785 RepID=A0A165CTP0_9APHY|nr:uncharacterized protein LAESUDRAFT_368461 [Laetiporus sulphureus 93-53]KZT03417.1 hypothetical protein LAESUDRAFT_368461 [Laetiporus sulphureus 93-53]
MALPFIGAHCSLLSCNLNDYLPIRCRACDQLFCKDHIAPELHECLTATLPQVPLQTAKRQRCAADGCERLTLESAILDTTDTVGRTPAVCPQCSLSFCSIHRAPGSHSCSNVNASDTTKQKNAAARRLLEKHFPPQPSSASSTGVQAPKAQSLPKSARDRNESPQGQKIAVMKMRHRASPADPKDKASAVPIEQRLYAFVSVDNSGTIGEPYWFRKSIITGKALDLLASRLGIISSQTNPLQLQTADGDRASSSILRTDMPLSSQIEDGARLCIVLQKQSDPS